MSETALRFRRDGSLNMPVGVFRPDFYGTAQAIRRVALPGIGQSDRHPPPASRCIFSTFEAPRRPVLFRSADLPAIDRSPAAPAPFFHRPRAGIFFDARAPLNFVHAPRVRHATSGRCAVSTSDTHPRLPFSPFDDSNLGTTTRAKQVKNSVIRTKRHSPTRPPFPHHRKIRPAAFSSPVRMVWCLVLRARQLMV